jgi:hypothetical protein
MIYVPIDMKFRDGYGIFSMPFPPSKQKFNKLILEFTNAQACLNYQLKLLDLIADMKTNESLSSNIGLQNKVTFCENLLLELVSCKLSDFLNYK